ncbi:MAG: SDR family NAD(P)-dependent oxidoreductase [Rikenellaceae bacterium]|nr:SDR family NAD(P)-dependent oxidoreductase [Rikenellaceae bacterium]
MAKSSVIIVGAGAAFGYELAKEFGSKGYKIVLIGRNVKAMKEISGRLSNDSITTEIYPVNLANPQYIRETLGQVLKSEPNIELMIYNAVARRNCSPSNLSWSEAMDDFAVSVAAAIEFTKIIIPYFRERGCGNIIFTGGGVATDPVLSAASMSLAKAALRNYALNLAAEFRGTGIFVALVTITEKNGGGKLTATEVAKKYFELFTIRNINEIIL